ncbi:hypothetical protein [Thalassoglobus polymorphus]|uniref:Uncharacterized protein n=1 Tax=Thalassoglobus polymorphus TaxID=2527994 RepID=A0A517QSJ0_9PLAN|nr:hypothetical protein [Thalassoglobus polymorphus]QDT34585.1 hypothetical protein Mal48_38480 [Thalassoglobus polymorphus]
MRTYQTRWQRSAMCIAVAAACASSLSTTIGCARGSAREVSTDLSKQASESAIRAERSIAARNQTPKDVDEREPQEPAGKVFLPGTSPLARQNPLAKLLKENAGQFPSEDPFLQLKNNQENEASEKNPDEKIMLTRHSNNSEPQSSLEREAAQDSSPVAKPFPSYVEVAPEDQNIKNPFAATGQTPAPTTKAKPSLTIRQTAERQTAEGRIAKSLPKLVASGPSHSSTARRAEFPAPETTATLGQWKSLDEKQTPNRGEKTRIAQPTKQVQAIEQPQEVPQDKNVEQFKRMKSLILQAKDQHARGELHAAYRSALLAQNIVTQNGLKLGPNEANPDTIAQEIAAMIWGANTQSSPNQKPRKEAELPIIQPRQQRQPVRHDQAFTTSPAYLNWQPSPQMETKKTAESSPAPPTQMDSADNKVVSAHHDNQSSSSQQLVQQLVGTKVQTDQQELKSLPETEPNTSVPGTGTSSATATVTTATVASRPMPQQVQSVASETKHFVETQSRQRVSPENIAATSAATIDLENPFDVEFKAPASVSPISSTKKEVVSSPVKNLKWGAIAFILATLSTLIGLKMSKSPKQAASEATEETDQENEDRPQLKISKAA